MNEQEKRIIKEIGGVIAQHVTTSVLEGVREMQIATPKVQPVVLVDASKVENDAITRGVPRNSLYNVYSSYSGGGGGTPAPNVLEIESAGFNTCYGGVNAFVSVIYNEDNTFNKFIAYLLDGSGTVVDPADITQMTNCPNILERTVCINGETQAVQKYLSDNSGVETIVGYYDALNNLIPVTGSDTVTVGLCIPTSECISNTVVVEAEAQDSNIMTAVNGYFAIPSNVVHTQLGNNLNLLGIGAGGLSIMASGIEINVTGGSANGSVITFVIENVYDTDPSSVDQDYAVIVTDNATGLAVNATSLTWSLPISATDFTGGGGLGSALFNSFPVGQTNTITWVGDLPVGNYTAQFWMQDAATIAPFDEYNCQISGNYTASTTSSKSIVTSLDQCTINQIKPIVTLPVVEVPNGLVITSDLQLSVATGTSVIRSFSVKGLGGGTYDISFDGGATYQVGIDGGDSWGEGNDNNLNIASVYIKPTVPAEKVFVHWETV